MVLDDKLRCLILPEPLHPLIATLCTHCCLLTPRHRKEEWFLPGPPCISSLGRCDAAGFSQSHEHYTQSLAESCGHHTCDACPLRLALARWMQDCLSGPPRIPVLARFASSQLTVSSLAYMLAAGQSMVIMSAATLSSPKCKAV